MVTNVQAVIVDGKSVWGITDGKKWFEYAYHSESRAQSVIDCGFSVGGDYSPEALANAPSTEDCAKANVIHAHPLEIMPKSWQEEEADNGEALTALVQDFNLHVKKYNSNG